MGVPVSSSERATSSRVAWIVTGLGLLALGLRVWSLNYGLPAIYNMDEKPILDRALSFAKGDPNPHNFLYPTLHLYAIFLWEGLFFAAGRLAGVFSSLAEFQNAYFVDPSKHVLAARALTAVLGAATIGGAYRFGARLFNAPVGIAAAGFLAVAPMAVRDAHYVKLDIPVALFSTLAFGQLASILVDPAIAARRLSWVIAGALAGLAISTHYYAAFLAVPFVMVAALDVSRSGRWQVSFGLLCLAGLATIAAFAATSPFFFVEPRTVIRDFTELREVDIDRAVSAGWFSSLPTYSWLLGKALGWPVCVLSVVGGVMALSTDVRRGLLLVSFPLAFVLFVSNTFPASRYLNIVLPCATVAAAYAAWRLATMTSAPSAAMAVACALAAIPALTDSVRWDRFFAQDDTRTVAERFVEREVPAGTTIAVQPYSAPLTQSREGLIEALRARLGQESKAPRKFQLQLAASPYPSPAYRLVYIGASGKTKAPPADVDKIYVAPYAFTDATGLEALRRLGVSYVVLTFYGDPPPAFLPLLRALAREATHVAQFTPYPAGGDAVPPFRHNSNMWLDARLERPGPVVDLWRIR